MKSAHTKDWSRLLPNDKISLRDRCGLGYELEPTRCYLVNLLIL